MFYLDISANTCCLRTVPQEVESIFKSRVFADNLSLCEFSASRQTIGKLIKQCVHDVYRNDFRQPYKLGEHRGVKSRPVAFLATNTEVRNLPRAY